MIVQNLRKKQKHLKVQQIGGILIDTLDKMQSSEFEQYFKNFPILKKQFKGYNFNFCIYM